VKTKNQQRKPSLNHEQLSAPAPIVQAAAAALEKKAQRVPKSERKTRANQLLDFKKFNDGLMQDTAPMEQPAPKDSSRNKAVEAVGQVMKKKIVTKLPWAQKRFDSPYSQANIRARSLTPDQPLVTPKAFLKRAGEPPTETELKMKAHLRKLTTQVLACTKMVKSVAFLPPTAGKFYLQQ